MSGPTEQGRRRRFQGPRNGSAGVSSRGIEVGVPRWALIGIIPIYDEGCCEEACQRTVSRAMREILGNWAENPPSRAIQRQGSLK